MRLLGVLAALCSVCASVGEAQPADLADRLEPIREKHGLPALAALVTTADGTVAIGAVGVRQAGDETPVTIDDLWHLGSCTKSMCGTLAAVFVERGLIGWDTTVGEVFGDEVPDMHDAYRDVTLEQLMCHRAGFSTQPPAQAWALARKQEGTVREQRDAFVAGVVRAAPVHEPGSAYEYSNQGTIAAGAMLERAWDDAHPEDAPSVWEELVADHLFEPLGIEAYGFGVPGSLDSVDQPRGHVQGPIPGSPTTPLQPGPFVDNPPAYGPAGRVHMSLEGWGTYVRAHLRGRAGATDILPNASWVHLHTDPFADPDAEPFTGYAMGWSVADRAWGGRAIAHAGSNTQWYCVVWASPEKGFAVLVATNLAGADNLGATATDEAAGALIGAYLEGEFGQ